jgi:predicted ester cyclase
MPALTEEPKRVAARYYEEVLTGRRLDVLEELLTPGFTGHDPAGAPIDRAGYFGAVQMIHDGFGRLVVTVEDQLAERDRVTTRWSATGTHTGWFAGIAATRRTVTMSGIDVHRLEGGRLAEVWEQLDFANLLAQLR